MFYPSVPDKFFRSGKNEGDDSPLAGCSGVNPPLKRIRLLFRAKKSLCWRSGQIKYGRAVIYLYRVFFSFEDKYIGQSNRQSALPYHLKMT